MLQQLAAHEPLPEALLELRPIHLRQTAIVVRFQQQVNSAMNLKTAQCQSKHVSGQTCDGFIGGVSERKQTNSKEGSTARR